LLYFSEKNLSVTGTKNEINMYTIKCGECGCYPKDCKNSNSSPLCPNCSWKECCCWTNLHESWDKPQLTSLSPL
jgi:hypothetical protein